ncbi:hypothetical protein LINPERHAP2_LOCUS11153, partial [Linum perenne]
MTIIPFLRRISTLDCRLPPHRQQPAACLPTASSPPPAARLL